MDAYLLGIDIGTTGAKTLLIRADGAQMWHAYMPYPLLAPKAGYSEQDAGDWWKALVCTVGEVMKKSALQPEKVAALSLSLQGGTMVPTDADYHPLRSAIVWNDIRGSKQMADFAQRFGPSYMYEKSGWSLSAGQNAMAIAWMRENEPDLFNKTAYFCSVPDWISHRLTGRAVVDISDSGINQLADIRAGVYDAGILDFCGICSEQLAPIVQSGEVIGPLTAAAAAELGLKEGTPVVSGAHDQFAGAIGAGLFSSGDAMLATGTTWGATALSDKHNFDRGFAQTVSPAPGKWGNYASIYTGGVCLEWLRKNVLGSAEAPLNYNLINEMACGVNPGCGGLTFYPYFCGSGFPERDNDSRAAFIELDLSHGKADMIRALMEGVAFQSVWALSAYGDAFGVRRLKMSGGATKSSVWRQIVAAVANMPVQIPEMPDLTCIGAAMLAGVGSGIYASVEEGYAKLAIPEITIYPEAEMVDIYQKLFEEYKRRAPLVRALYFR